MAEEPGTRFGPYRLVAPIGSGGFATVYRAVDERLEADVAVKVLAENHALDLELRERFLREAQLLRRVACEAVVPLYDLGETARAQPYLVLAFADRGDLRARVAQRLATGNPVTAGDLQTVADTLAVALGRAHRVGLVHRDVKPTNLLIASTRGEPRGRPLGWSSLLGADERLLLGDLGLAKDLTATSGLTVGSGTQGFNAPEQRTGAGQVDVRADVYGASAVLYWMATGAVPSDRADERAAHLAGAAPTLPGPMRDAILRGLADHPDQRFGTIDDWHRALAPEAAPPAGHEATTGWRSPSGRRAGAAALAAAVLLAGAVLLYRSTRSGLSDLGGGRAEAAGRSGPLHATVAGPRSVPVGQPASFVGSTDAAATYLWLTPDGQVVRDNPLVLRSSTAGDARVTLVAADAAGHTVTIVFPFTVSPG